MSYSQTRVHGIGVGKHKEGASVADRAPRSCGWQEGKSPPLPKDSRRHSPLDLAGRCHNPSLSHRKGKPWGDEGGDTLHWSHPGWSLVSFGTGRKGGKGSWDRVSGCDLPDLPGRKVPPWGLGTGSSEGFTNNKPQLLFPDRNSTNFKCRCI